MFRGSNVQCSEPIFNTQFVSGWPKFHAEMKSSMKPALTKFQLLTKHPSENKSLVLCTPTTGRTHQIRKHLALLGHPISNDPIYSDSLFLELTKEVQALETSTTDHAAVKDVFTKLQNKVETNMTVQQLGTGCEICGTKLYRDPKPQSLMIYLHALRYSEEGTFKFETVMPSWANF